jgi:aldehyde dehydrogenase (NAD+)
MYKDLGRGRYEAEVLEVGLISTECDSTLKQLKSWMKPVYVGTPMAMLPATSMMVYEPYGVALIIGPFNYPMQLMVRSPSSTGC